MQEETIFRQAMKLMGNRFEISVVAADEAWANDMIALAVNEIKRIEAQLTTFRDDSETNLINANAGIEPVAVSDEIFRIIERSLRISSLTQGAFDISYGSIDKRLWNFDTNMDALPDPDTAKKMVRLVNYKNILLDKEKQTVFLKNEGMRIGFGGIGKGYAAEKAKELLKKNGVISGIVNASGDLAAWGYQPGGKPWTVGIVHPDFKEFPFSYMNISDMAIATSGNYEKYISIGGKKYSHTIHPRTGLPVTGIKSVSVISTNAEICDALTTPVMVMGIKHGLSLVNQMNDVACVIIDDDNKIYTSHNIKCS